MNPTSQQPPRLGVSTLFQAKSFLCWDVFPDQLAVQLIPMQANAGYYVPPGNPLLSIYIFYEPDAKNQSIPLFLLFHEAGHITVNTNEQSPARTLDVPNGPQRREFEKQAWNRGERLLTAFCRRQALATESVLAAFQQYAETCLESYNGSTGID